MRFFGVVSGRAVQSQNFGTERLNIWGLFLDSSGLCVLFLCVIAKKMNNMLVV